MEDYITRDLWVETSDGTSKHLDTEWDGYEVQEGALHVYKNIGDGHCYVAVYSSGYWTRAYVVETEA